MSRPPSMAPRDRILAAASTLFSEQGVKATGVDSLIGTAGVAKATFYRYFPSKDDLVVAWLMDPRTRWFDRVRERVERGDGSGDIIPRLFDGVAEWLEEEDFRGCPFLNTPAELADPDHPAAPVIRSYLAEIEGSLADILRAAGHRQAEAKAKQLQVILAGAISLAVARRTTASTRAARAVAIELFAAR